MSAGGMLTNFEELVRVWVMLPMRRKFHMQTIAAEGRKSRAVRRRFRK